MSEVPNIDPGAVSGIEHEVLGGAGLGQDVQAVDPNADIEPGHIAPEAAPDSGEPARDPETGQFVSPEEQ